MSKYSKAFTFHQIDPINIFLFTTPKIIPRQLVRNFLVWKSEENAISGNIALIWKSKPILEHRFFHETGLFQYPCRCKIVGIHEGAHPKNARYTPKHFDQFANGFRSVPFSPMERS